MKNIIIIIFVLLTTDLFSQTLDPGPFQNADVISEYPGGIQRLYNYISDSLRYPPEALEMNIEGMVNVYFVLNSHGQIIKELTKVDYSTNQLFNEEAIRLVNNSGDWIPAKLTKEGPSIKSQRIIPIRFIIVEKKKSKKKRKK